MIFHNFGIMIHFYYLMLMLKNELLLFQVVLNEKPNLHKEISISMEFFYVIAKNSYKYTQ